MSVAHVGNDGEKCALIKVYVPSHNKFTYAGYFPLGIRSSTLPDSVDASGIPIKFVTLASCLPDVDYPVRAVIGDMELKYTGLVTVTNRRANETFKLSQKPLQS